jgi:hypothetical protein
MLLIPYCIQGLEGFYLRVIGIHYFAIISKVPFFQSISQGTVPESWSRPDEKKLKKVQKGDDTTKRYLVLRSFSTVFRKSGDVHLLVHMGKITLI